MLADALDGTLSTTDQAAFDLHVAMCPGCSTMLADAQRGVAWLEMLKSPRPEPSADLLDRILAQTCNSNESVQSQKPNTLLGHSAIPVSHPAIYGSGKVLPFRSRVASMFHPRAIGQTLQPRLAMTAAMAFFSIALTLNLVGVHISHLKLSDLKPSTIKRNFYEANAHVTRYYTNLKVVYELESRVRDLQRSNDNDNSYTTLPNQSAPAASPAQQTPQGQPQNSQPGNQKQSRPKPGPGSSQRENTGKKMYLANFSPSFPRHAPLPAHKAFAVFTPNTLKSLQEGELV